MPRETGIVVVDRLKLLRDHGPPLRSPAVDGSHEEICRRYKGFDGVLWPESDRRKFDVEDGLASLEDLADVDRYLMEVASRNDCDIIAVSRDGGELPPGSRPWGFVGFDIGYLESEWSQFSITMNEVIYGTIPELRKFAKMLNEHLLVPTQELAYEVMREHNRLAATGADVEEVTDIELIAIFLRREENRIDININRQSK